MYLFIQQTKCLLRDYVWRISKRGRSRCKGLGAEKEFSGQYTQSIMLARCVGSGGCGDKWKKQARTPLGGPSKIWRGVWT